MTLRTPSTQIRRSSPSGLPPPIPQRHPRRRPGLLGRYSIPGRGRAGDNDHQGSGALSELGSLLRELVEGTTTVQAEAWVWVYVEDFLSKEEVEAVVALLTIEKWRRDVEKAPAATAAAVAVVDTYNKQGPQP